jgi:hypothetical protein
VTNLLQSPRVITSSEAIGQRFKAYACLLQLLLGPFVPIEADLDFKGKVTANLNEKQAEVLIEDVEIVMCHIDRLPTILKPNPLTTPSSLRFVAQSLLLAFADQHYTLLTGKLSQIFFGYILLLVLFLKPDKWYTLFGRKPFV